MLSLVHATQLQSVLSTFSQGCQGRLTSEKLLRLDSVQQLQNSDSVRCNGRRSQSLCSQLPGRGDQQHQQAQGSWQAREQAGMGASRDPAGSR